MKTLYVNLDGEDVASDAQVEVAHVDLDFNFWLYLGEQLSSGLRVDSRSALLSRFVEECPEAAEPLLDVWEELKGPVLGDSPSGSVPVTLGSSYFQWLKFSDMPQAVRDRYRDREELTLDVDVEELAEMVLDDVKQTAFSRLNDRIMSVVFSNPAVTRRSPLVRFLKKCDEDLVFVPFDRWTWPDIPSAKSHAKEAPAAAPARCYKVGDYYNENGKEGVVFEVDASGRHGKIVALQDLPGGKCWAWCNDSCYNEVKIGIDDKEDGMKNLETVRRIPDWQKKFPAFEGCAALGEGWYLPAKEELKKIYENRAALPNLETVECPWYWSSSENGSTYAWYVYFNNGSLYNGYKFYQYRARAVAAF